MRFIRALQRATCSDSLFIPAEDSASANKCLVQHWKLSHPSCNVPVKQDTVYCMSHQNFIGECMTTHSTTREGFYTTLYCVPAFLNSGAHLLRNFASCRVAVDLKLYIRRGEATEEELAAAREFQNYFLHWHEVSKEVERRARAPKKKRAGLSLYASSIVRFFTVVGAGYGENMFIVYVPFGPPPSALNAEQKLWTRSHFLLAHFATLGGCLCHQVLSGIIPARASTGSFLVPSVALIVRSARRELEN